MKVVKRVEGKGYELLRLTLEGQLSRVPVEALVYETRDLRNGGSVPDVLTLDGSALHVTRKRYVPGLRLPDGRVLDRYGKTYADEEAFVAAHPYDERDTVLAFSR